jgi:ABC-type sugar transport system ATPase subunit
VGAVLVTKENLDTPEIKAYVGPASPAQRWHQGMGMVSEDRKQEGLSLSLSIADNLTLSSLDPVVKPAGQTSTTKEWIKKLAIRCREPQQPVGNLSGGTSRKWPSLGSWNMELTFCCSTSQREELMSGARHKYTNLSTNLLVRAKRS